MAEIITDYDMLQGGWGGPLREFIGNYLGYDLEERSTNRGPVTIIKLKFDDVEIIKSIEPYPYPTVMIDIPYSVSRNMQWGVFLKSLRAQGYSGPVELEGKRARMYLEVGRLMFTSSSGDEVVRDCWQVSEVMGDVDTISETHPIENTVLTFLNGRTRADFSNSVFNEVPASRQDMDLMSGILDGSWFDSVLERGMATIDDAGVYHIV